MATLDEIRRALDNDELDYPELAHTYGASALPQLKALVGEDEPRIAPKAAYLAGVISEGSAMDVVALAAQSRHDVVRVAAAAASALLPVAHAEKIASDLLQDHDPGVRVRAAKSAVTINTPMLIERLKTMATKDTEPHIRDFATGVTGNTPQPR